MKKDTIKKIITNNFGLGLKQSINIHKAIGFNKRKSPNIIKKRHFEILNNKIKFFILGNELKQLKANQKEFYKNIKTSKSLKLNYKIQYKYDRISKKKIPV